MSFDQKTKIPESAVRKFDVDVPPGNQPTKLLGCITLELSTSSLNNVKSVDN